MSYKTEFQANNTDLQTILDTVNNLPDVAGGAACGVVNVTTKDTSITIPGIIGKDKVMLTYIGEVSTTSKLACVTGVYIDGSDCYSTVAYTNSVTSANDASLLSYDKSTGTIQLLQSYNEYFCPGPYAYVAMS